MIKPFVNYMAARDAQADAEVLLNDGDWTIEKLRQPEEGQSFRSSRSKYYSLLKHVCYPNGYEGQEPYPHKRGNYVYQVVVYPDDSSHCWRCTKEIPEGMIAVWKFQNWEVLQYGG
ncbi:hypothetical protein LCGC14_0208110 [marine sediment metagenome]|uniref:Uncharacterized protein n=1 Tax=marine sediment metagenome TaxID=412755 RepID=A0A0F9UGI9_9ZZZZ